MSKKNKKEKVKYSTLSNIIYLIKNIWKWDKILFILISVQIPITVIIPLLSIYMPKIVIDAVAYNASISQFMIKVGTPILGIIALNILRSASSSITSFKKIDYRFKYLKSVMDKSIDTDFENIDGAEGQQKIAKAYEAIQRNDSATEIIVNVIIELFSNIIGFIIYAGIISSIHPIITLFIIVSSAVNYFVGKYVNNYEYKNKDNIVSAGRKLEYITNKTGDFKSAKDIRLYDMFPWFKNIYNTFQKKEIYFRKKNIKRRYFANFIDGVLLFLRDGITYGFLIYSVIYKNMEIGNFVLYFGAVGGLSRWLSGIVRNLNSLNRISLEMYDLRAYLDIKDKMNRGKGIELPKPSEMPCGIELRNVYYRYPGAKDYTIKNINLHVNKGEKLALVGANGAGKTTLVKLICGLYTPTKGEIYINGKKSSLYNRDEYYTLFSVVFQDIHLLPVSIEDNIALNADTHIDEKKMKMIIELSGLKEKINSLPNGSKTMLVKSVNKDAVELSGGEMQKLVLARALYKNAPIIILDEPTAALDPISEFEIYSKFNKIVNTKTAFYISHRLSSCRFCDEIAVFDKGKIIQKGTHEELLKDKNNKYYELWNAQAKYYNENESA